MTAKEDVTASTLNVQQTHNFKSEKLIEEIIQKRDENEVFGDIVIYILHETQMLDNTNELVEKETMTALESVYVTANSNLTFCLLTL